MIRFHPKGIKRRLSLSLSLSANLLFLPFMSSAEYIYVTLHALTEDIARALDPCHLSAVICVQVLLNISYGNNAPNVHLKQLNPYFEVAFGHDYHSQDFLLGFSSSSSHCFFRCFGCHSWLAQRWGDAPPRMGILHGVLTGFQSLNTRWWSYRFNTILSDTIWFYVIRNDTVCFHRILINTMINHLTWSIHDHVVFAASLVMLPTASTPSRWHMAPW